MLIQADETDKLAVAEGARVAVAVPGAAVGLVVGRAGPLDEVLGDEALGVL